MIIYDKNIFLDIVIDDEKFSKLTIRNVEELLEKFKYENNDLKPKEIVNIPNCFAYFSDDRENNKFTCKIYKTSTGTDRWIMLMKDENEGYALYENPASNEYELAWYHKKLEEPVSELEEEKIRTCYVPKRK